MANEQIVGPIIMVLCCGLCALTCWSIGSWSEKASKPVSFWSGTTVQPDKVLDLRGYNHANAVMWKLYSAPFWLAAIISCLGFWGEIYIIVAAVLLGAACVPGLVFLIWGYRMIEKKYLKP